METVGGGCAFGLVPFSTSSHSGINTLEEIHLSWKIWRAALLSAAANFPHLPVVRLTTPPTLPRSKAALWRRQEGSGAKQRCADKAGGGERPILKAHGCGRGLRVALFKAVLLCFLAGNISLSSTFNNRCVRFSSLFLLSILLPDFTFNLLPTNSL